MITKKQEILNAAAELFSQKGYRLSVSDIAKEVAIKPPSIYSHFQNKDDIIEQIVINEIEHFYNTILNKYLEIAPCSTSKEKLERIFGDVLDYFSTEQRLRFWKNISLIENEELKEKCKAIIREHELKFYKDFEKIFLTGIEKHEINQAIHEGHKLLFLAMLQGLIYRVYTYHYVINEPKGSNKIWNAYWDSIKEDGNT